MILIFNEIQEIHTGQSLAALHLNICEDILQTEVEVIPIIFTWRQIVQAMSNSECLLLVSLSPSTDRCIHCFPLWKQDVSPTAQPKPESDYIASHSASVCPCHEECTKVCRSRECRSSECGRRGHGVNQTLRYAPPYYLPPRKDVAKLHDGQKYWQHVFDKRDTVAPPEGHRVKKTTVNSTSHSAHATTFVWRSKK